MQNLKAIDTFAKLPWKDCHMQSNCMKYLYITMDYENILSLPTW